MAEEIWDNSFDYLKNSRFLSMNDDYFEFLVKRVWKLNQPMNVIDFGCGYGFLGTKLMPLLPEGSTYTGIDKSAALLKEGEKLYANLPWKHDFVESSAYNVPFEEDHFDLAVSYVMMMHLERAADALSEIIRVTRSGGKVITCDANRNAFNALLYSDGLAIQELMPIGLGQQMNRSIRETSGIDYNIGIKMPVLMEKAGLTNVGSRMSDAVRVLSPNMPDESKARLFKAFCDEGLALPDNFEEIRPKIVERLLGYGIHQDVIDRQLEMEQKWDFRHKGDSYYTVHAGLLTWTCGTVVK